MSSRPTINSSSSGSSSGQSGGGKQLVKLTVNNQQTEVAIEPRRVLLDVLRHNVGLTGAKKVCEMGDCGACTVHLNGEPVYSCLILGVECAGQRVDTVEGLATGNQLDALQQAFIDADAFQCGFCTSGQLMALKALFNDSPSPDDEQIVTAVSGNLCRCGAYQNIVKAAQLVRDGANHDA